MIGRTAAGKTTTAKFLSDVLDIEHILFSKYKRIVLNDNYSPIDSLREDLRDIGYKSGINYAHERLKVGKSVILDASFHKAERRLWAYSGLSGNCDLLIRLYCRTSDIDETRRRIELRRGLENQAQHHASEFSVFEFINKTFDEPTDDEIIGYNIPVFTFEIDTFKLKIVKLPTRIIQDSYPICKIIAEHLDEYLKNGMPNIVH